MRVKICGLRSEADLAAVSAAGADAVGFLVGLTHVSEDRLEPELARRLIARIPPFVQPVLVTHLADPRQIASLADHLGVAAVQLHGEMSDEQVGAVRDLLPQACLIRAVHISAGAIIEELGERVQAIGRVVNGVLLDSRTPQRLGGTGQPHDWGVSRCLVELSPVPVILAGGLTPANVATAIRIVRPYGVDVNSGVDTPTGNKSPLLCEQFVAHAHTEETL